MFGNVPDWGWRMNDTNPGTVAKQGGIGGPAEGNVWTGFEWVTPERYEQLRAPPNMFNLPPIQGTRAESWGIDAAWDNLGAKLEAEATVQRVEPQAPTKPAGTVDTLTRAFTGVLALLDPVPGRGGLAETPGRAAKAWLEWTSGYSVDPGSVLKVFEDGAEDCDEMVVVADIPVYSHCEHHMAAIFGTATIAYIPDGKIVGLSKLHRLVDIFARRLQVQERMTNQIANAMMEHLKPRGVGVVINARHMCMESRGVNHVGGYTTSSALRGVFREDAAVRAEFLALTRK